MLLDEGFLDKLRQRLDSNEKSNDVFLKKLNDLKRKLIMIQDPKEAEKIRNRFWQNVAIANTLKKYKNRGSSQDMSKISDAELQAYYAKVLVQKVKIIVYIVIFFLHGKVC